ncbi:MAG: efflux RND transporter permease subunit, partial [Planctomycetota bacterium]
MSIAGFAVRNRTIVCAFVLVLTLWGSLSYMSMPRREDPEYVVRTCQVLTEWPGTPTVQVEELVTFPLENEINGLDGIRWVKSETTVGRSSILVELDRATPGNKVDQMWDKVRSRVERVRMPDPSIRPLVIDDFGDTNILVMAMYQVPLSGDDAVREENRYSPRDLDIFSQLLKDEVKLLPGVAKVSRVGVQREVVYIETDAGAWSRLGLTTSQLQGLLAERNVIAPGGVIDTDVGRFSVKPSGDLDAVAEVSRVIVDSSGEGTTGAPVYLEDLGLEITRTYEDPAREIVRYGDADTHTDAVVVAFSMKGGANIVDVCADGRALVDTLKGKRKALPPDLAVSFVSDQSENVTRKINDFIWNVIGAIAIVVAVVLLMAGLRTALVMAANIPLVVIGTLALIPLFGVQMEQISLAAMIIALGMLVDNAVQIADQTQVNLQLGMSSFEAARSGSDRLAFPILIATGTTVAAFYPMLLGLQGSTKEYIYSLPVTLTVVLLLSYVLAMTFCVLLAAWLIKA